MTPIIETTAEGLRIESCPLRVRAMFAGHVVADTDGALKVYEPDRAMRFFIPRDDVEIGYLGRTVGGGDFDPLIGEATFYTWVMDGDIIEKAVCEYERPAAGAERLRHHFWLDPTVFELYELSERDLEAAPRATHIHGGAA
jgi:uncharacterized protein (DUF427 family)